MQLQSQLQTVLNLQMSTVLLRELASTLGERAPKRLPGLPLAKGQILQQSTVRSGSSSVVPADRASWSRYARGTRSSIHSKRPSNSCKTIDTVCLPEMAFGQKILLSSSSGNLVFISLIVTA